MNKETFLKKNLVYIVIFLVFVFVIGLALTFTYIEGDDASSIAYHVMGRDKTIQLPYRPYHAMMDVVLSVFPTDEAVLRVAALTISALATPFLPILLLVLVFDWLKDETTVPKLLVGLVFLLAVPELYYFGLVFTPTILGMDLILCAHLILRRKVFPRGYADIKTNQQWGYLIASLLLFGVGVAFRWNTVVYGLVIFTDMLTSMEGLKTEKFKKRLTRGVIWGAAALVVVYLVIWLAGYQLIQQVIDIFSYSNFYKQVGSSVVSNIADLKDALMQLALTLSPLLTPVFGILLLVGLFLLIKRKDSKIFLVIASFLAVSFYIQSGVPKFLIALLPSLVLMFVVGLDGLYNWSAPEWVKSGAYVMMVILLLIPWFVGVEAQVGDSSWGPGFEIKAYDRPYQEGMSLQPVLGPGLAFPTPEGPRPLYGHFYVLLGGQWRSFANEQFGYYEEMVDTAIEENIPLVITNWSPDMLLIILERRGYDTTDWQDKESACCAPYVERDFTDASGDEVALFYSEFEGIWGDEIMARLAVFEGQYEQIVFSGYPSIVRELYFSCDSALDALGPFSAVVDIGAVESCAP